MFGIHKINGVSCNSFGKWREDKNNQRITNLYEYTNPRHSYIRSDTSEFVIR